MIKIGIVGGGVFTWSFLWQFSQLSAKYKNNISVTLFDGHNIKSSCSLNSTALVARRAQSFGVSPLGDLIQKSWCWWMHTIEKFQLQSQHGVTLAPLFYNEQAHGRRLPYLQQLPSLNQLFHLHKVHRIETSLLIDPLPWLKFLQKQTILNFKINQVNFVQQEVDVDSISIERQEIAIREHKSTYDFLVIQPGAYKITGFNVLAKEEVVYGSYLEFEKLSTSYPQSFSYSSDYHLYYRKHLQNLQLGIFSSLERSEEMEWLSLQKLYAQVAQDGWTLPPIELAQKKWGARHKIKHRLPVVGKLQRCFYHLGGYKIGYLSSLYQSQQLALMLLKDL